MNESDESDDDDDDEDDGEDKKKEKKGKTQHREKAAEAVRKQNIETNTTAQILKFINPQL